MPSFSKSTKARLLLFGLLFALALQAQSATPDATPDSTAAPDRWRVHLTFDKAALSGLCLVRTLGDTLVGAVVNEFGLQAFDFIFDRRRGKVQLSHLLPMLDHWYIRRTLRRDLAQLLIDYRPDAPLHYHNERRNIDYLFTPLPDDSHETASPPF